MRLSEHVVSEGCIYFNEGIITAFKGILQGLYLVFIF